MKINPFSKRRSLAVIGIFAMLVGLFPGSVFAQAPEPAQVVVPVPGGPLTVNVVVVNDGAGGQTDPHASGDWFSYTDNSVSGIRFQNLDLGTPSDRLIPVPENHWDALSNISDGKIVFTRAWGSSNSIYLSQIDPFGNPTTAIEVSPVAGVLRRLSAIGGDTIVYEDRTYDPSSSGSLEISLSSAENLGAPAYRLTNDTLVDWFPAVSPDGNAVVWLKSTVATSDKVGEIWRAERMDGTWGAPEQLPGETGDKSSPDTNGAVTVYASNAGGDQNIRWSVRDDSGTYAEYVLALPGVQRNPNMADNLISFESNTTPNSQFDLWLYDLAMNQLYQLTDTSVSETLSDVTINAFGVVRVVWAQPKQVSPYDLDVYTLSVVLDTTPPVITPTISGTQGANGWYTSDVTLSWAVSDAQSPFTSTGCDTLTIASDQAATQYTCSASSDGGASSETATVARDATKPVTTVNGVAEGATYNLGSVPQAGCASTDALSGVATEATLALTGGDAQGAGNITATCSGALDNAGNAADPAVVHYTVSIPLTTYSFTGFFQPVDNPGEGPSYVFNSVKAGAAVPVKFSLGGDQGLDIFAADFPKSQPVSCTTAALSDPIEETVTAGNSSLSYDPASDTYTYVWKTNKAWAGTCRVLNMKLDDATPHLAYFRFK